MLTERTPETPEEAPYLRLSTITYPNARIVYYNYPDSGIGLALSRLDNIASDPDPDPNEKYAAYTYLGTGTIVKVEHPGVTGGLDLFYGEEGTYDGFDRFGRVIDQKWQDTQGTPVVKDRFRYGYDANSNRTWREVGYGITGGYSGPPTFVWVVFGIFELQT